MDESFRAARNKWLETSHERRSEEAYKVFESCLFEAEKKPDDDNEQEAER